MTSVTVYLVRHAHAQARDTWLGPDARRPLTDRGVRQATGLVDRFSARDHNAVVRAGGASGREPRPTLLRSSSAERCLATLRPLAVSCELPIVGEDALGEGSSAKDALELINALARIGSVPVLCTHGDVIWKIVDMLKGTGVLFAGPVEVKKGSVLVLESEDGSIRSGSYIPAEKA